MANRERHELLEIFAEFDTAIIAASRIPGVYRTPHVDEFGTAGYGPTFMCSGKYSDEDTATLDGEANENTVSVGDTVTKIIDDDGDETGAFTIREIRADGTGAVVLQLEAQ